MRVLIAEDDLTSRTMLEGVLKKWGYAPVVTSDGQSAWQELQGQDPPRLVILDWNMPGIDGLEVCRKLRQTPDSNLTYVILLTARGAKSDIVAGLDAGANDYISKPYDIDELHARIGVGQRMVELQAELKNARDALAYEARHDSLTAILNRRTIRDALSRELARVSREGGMVAVGLCDIDFFKKVNDTYGHQAGDEVLCALVRCLRGNLREYDYIGRYGGEEFLIVISSVDSLDEAELFGRLCRRIEQDEIQSSAGTLRITASIGVARGIPNDTVDTIVARADVALYRAKHNGRNQIAIAREDDLPQSLHCESDR